jgi:hypothetical protein
VQGSGLYSGLFGQAYDEIKNGFGGELQIRYTPSRLSIGAGVQLTFHSLEEGDASDNVKIWGAFIEPRLRIRTASPTFAPYLSARLAYLRLSVNTDDVNGSAGGGQINGGGGVLFRLSRRMNLDLGATFGYATFKDLESDAGAGSTIELGSGTNLVVRAGLTFGLFN